MHIILFLRSVHYNHNNDVVGTISSYVSSDGKEILYNIIALPRAIQKIKHSTLGLNANIALDLASCYISHLGFVPRAYFPYSTGGNDLTITYIVV